MSMGWARNTHLSSSGSDSRIRESIVVEIVVLVAWVMMVVCFFRNLNSKAIAQSASLDDDLSALNSKSKAFRRPLRGLMN